MAFTLKQSGTGQGESAMKTAQTLKDGGEIKDLEYADESGKHIWYPYILVDKSNAGSFS
ncbi:hypothetical protein [uncultured Clostridium sp.]|uniref:hypothetical protein n=1 Tax=uncultured Clostridium sp. TaxID=59620 RepID=UPI0025E43AA2|nr:hypothetical protein [uncultured Clostridium sp.]